MFSMVTVASSTRMPTASASPPSVITLMVSPNTDSAVIDARMASGIEIVMISVDANFPGTAGSSARSARPRWRLRGSPPTPRH